MPEPGGQEPRRVAIAPGQEADDADRVGGRRPVEPGIARRGEHGLLHQGHGFERIVEPVGAMQELADADDDGCAGVEGHVRTIRIAGPPIPTVLDPVHRDRSVRLVPGPERTRFVRGRGQNEPNAPDVSSTASGPSTAAVLHSEAMTESSTGRRIAIGSDHAGYELKQHLVTMLLDRGHEVDDHGTDSTESVDYPPICAGCRPLGPRRRGRCRHRARRQRSGRAARRQQGARCPRRAVQLPLHRAPGPRPQRRQRPGDRRARRRRRPRRGDRRPVPVHRRSKAAAMPAASTRSWSSKPSSEPPERSPARRNDHEDPQMPFPSDTDPDIEVQTLIEREIERQTTGLQLIASENFTSPAVMRAVGSVLTNKYAEGYPGKRYYGGNGVIDSVEALAIERAKELFGADHANVQPHSGANANMCAYQALLQPGDTVLGLSLDHGGHLTHGSPVNASGMLYNFVPYGVGGRGADRHRPGARPRARAPSEDDRRRHDELPAPARPRAVPRDRRRGRRAACCSTSPTSPGSSPAAPIRTRCRSPTSSRSRPTRPCAVRAAAASCRRPSTPRRSTRRCSPAGRAARSST